MNKGVIIADSACIMYYLFLYDRDGNLFIDDISFYKPMFMLDCNQCFYNLVCTRFRVGHQFNMSWYGHLPNRKCSHYQDEERTLFVSQWKHGTRQWINQMV